MKCHYTYDEIAGKVLIPGCIGTAALGISNCTCRNNYPETFEAFEKIEYRKKVKEQSDKLKELEKENARLNRIIKNLLKRQMNG